MHHDAELLVYLREHAHERQRRRTVVEQVVVEPDARPVEYLTDDAEHDLSGRVRRGVLLHGNSRTAGHEGTTDPPLETPATVGRRAADGLFTVEHTAPAQN